MTKDQLVGLLGTSSRILNPEEGPGAKFARRVRAFLDRQPWDQVDLPLICRCLRSTRLPGPGGPAPRARPVTRLSPVLELRFPPQVAEHGQHAAVVALVGG